MQFARRRSPTGPLWLFVLALLLRAAMPFVANASAEWQGRAIGEICSVYGVVLDARHHGAPESPAAEQGGDHCVLHALATLGTAAPPPASGAVLPSTHAPLPQLAASPPRADAAANWFARRKQGPPALA